MKIQTKIISCICFFCISIAAFSQSASFTVQPDGVCGNLRVKIINTSNPNGNPATYTFNPKPKADSTYTFDSAGMKEIKLIMLIGSTQYPATKTILVRPKPNAYFLFRDTLDLGEKTFVFRPAPQKIDSITYACNWTFWGNEVKTDNSINRNPVIHTFGTVLPDVDTAFVQLKITDTEGCTDTYNAPIRVTNSFDVPNFFTPNGDGINDYFTVPTNKRTVYSLQIFTRTGMLIYKNVSPTIMWDGNTATGEKVNPGTYYYVIEPVDILPSDALDKSNKKAGFVVLIRNKKDM